MPAGDILLNQLDLQVPGESGSGSQPAYASKDNGLMLYVNRGDDSGGEDQIVYCIVDVDGNVVAGPGFWPNQIIFPGASRFILEPVGTATGFALAWVETSFGASINRRVVVTHMLDNGTVSINPTTIDSLPTTENNPPNFMRANRAGDKVAICYGVENGAQGTTPREFRFVEFNVTGGVSTGPFKLDESPGGAQVLNIQNPQVVADLDDSGWAVFWGSNQGGSPVDQFNYARIAQGGAVITPKTTIINPSTGDEQNLFDVAATTTGFAALLEREVNSRDRMVWIHVSQNGATVSPEVDMSEVIQLSKEPGRTFNPNSANPGRGTLITDPNGGTHVVGVDRVISQNNIEIQPSQFNPTTDRLSLPGVFGPFTTTNVDFTNTGGALPTPITTQTGFWIISNENTGNDDEYYLYADFFDAITDQNRVDILDQGTGTHFIVQDLFETFMAYAHIDESGTVTAGPHLINNSPSEQSRDTENDRNHVELVDNDNLIVHSSELVNTSPTERVLNAKRVNRNNGVVQTIFEINQTVFGTNFTNIGGIRDVANDKRATWMHSRPSSNRLTVVDSLPVFRAVQDDGTNNLVEANLEVS